MKDRKKNLICIGVLFVVALITMMPMFTSPYHSSHDTKFHLKNVEVLTEQLKKDVISPSHVVGEIANDFGYGVGLFYGVLPHTITSYVNLIVGNPTISLKIIHFLTLFLSGITMFFCSKKLSKSHSIGLLSAIIYMLFPYHLSDIYIRDALSESFLFIFLPMIALSLYELMEGNKKSFYPLFVIGYVGGMLSHLTMMVYLTVIILIFLMVKWKFTIKNLKTFLMASLLILAISSPFLVGLLQQKLLGNYRVFVEGVMVQGTWGNALNPFSYINVFENYGNEIWKFFIDITTLVLLIITLCKYKKVNHKFYNYILLFGVVCLILSTKIFPWDIFPKSFRIIQFPWRFETFVALAVALIAPLCLKLLPERKHVVCVLGVIMILLSQPNLRSATEEIINMNDLPSWYGLGYQQEYLPQATYENKEYFDSRDDTIHILKGDGEVTIKEDDVPKLTFNVETEETLQVELPRLSYIGYTLKDDTGKDYPLEENEYGFLKTTVSSGQYVLDFTGTTINHICKYVSLITVILSIGVWIVPKGVRKNGQD